MNKTTKAKYADVVKHLFMSFRCQHQMTASA